MHAFIFRKIVFIFIVGTLLTGCLGKPFPKRLRGTYTGIQENYTVSVDDKEVKVPETKLNIELQYDHIRIKSEHQKSIISYTIAEKTENHYPLKLTFDDGTIENWKLYPKGKKLIRSEQAPRPSVTFLKE